MLEGVGVGRQAVPHQRLQLHLAEGAARAFVAQDLLQRHDVGGEPLDLLLRLVDHREARHHRGEGLVGFLEALVEALGDLAGDLVQAAVDGLRQLLHALAELPVHALERVLQQALLGAALLDELFQHRGLELAEVLGDGRARLRQALGLPDLQGGELALHAVGLLGEAGVQVGQYGTMARFHVLHELRGQGLVFAAQRLEPEQQDDAHCGEEGKAKNQANFEGAHGAILPAAGGRNS